MDTNKLTTKSRDAVSAALRNALTAGNPNAEPSHLLHALLMVQGNTVAPLLQTVGADPLVVDAAAQGAIARLPAAKGSSVSQPQMSGSFWTGGAMGRLGRGTQSCSMSSTGRTS